MSYCIVDRNVISNIVEASPEFAALQGWIENQGWGIGWVSDGNGGFVLPDAPEQPEPVPDSCSRRQGLLALLSYGHRKADIEALIAAITDEIEREAAQIEYEAAAWERANPFLQSMWEQLGGTPEQLDDLFRLAVTL